jgi:hypothetical protein
MPIISTQVAEAGESQIHGQPGLLFEILSQTTKKFEKSSKESSFGEGE